ncbi:MAG: addiction module protein [Thermoguttaceae bacterium]
MVILGQCQAVPVADLQRSMAQYRLAGYRVSEYNIFMNTASTLAIETLSISEKLLLMERLWEDLSRRPSDVPAPDWHGDVLAERQAAVREGRTSFVEWEAAKERLRERFQ